MLLHNKKWLFAAAASLVLAACGSTQHIDTSLYQWGKGEQADSVYQSLTHEGDPQEQLQKLEILTQDLKGKKIAPGLYAQLGLLYNQAGDANKAAAAFNREAELFPEAKPYMQFLLNRGKIPAETPKKPSKTKGGKK